MQNKNYLFKNNGNPPDDNDDNNLPFFWIGIIVFSVAIILLFYSRLNKNKK